VFNSKSKLGLVVLSFNSTSDLGHILQIAFWSKQTLKHNISFNREKRREKNEKTAAKRSKHGPEQLIEVLKVSQKEREKTCIL
jgi:hypothetical protein